LAKVSLQPQHMYCRELNYEDEEGSFSMTVEDTPCGDELLVWKLNIPGDEERRNHVIQELRAALPHITRNRMVLIDGVR
jgi:hypothetical protein